MLPRERRLNSSQFLRVFRQGRTRADELLTVKVLPNGLEVSRFGFSVGRKLGSAVDRNRLKRRLREMVRSLPIRDGWDVIIIVRKEAAGVPFEVLSHSLCRLLSLAGILEGKK